MAYERSVPVTVDAIGSVQPIRTVDVTARVTGELARVHFSEGDDVREGDPLFTLDPRPLAAALKQARAVVTRDRAQSVNADVEEQRYAKLYQAGVASREQYLQRKTAADTARATLRSDEAAVVTAKLNLDYATIRAPITGRTGQILVTEGNLVTANATTPLVVINQMQPISVIFPVPEEDLPRIRSYVKGDAPLEVMANEPGTTTTPSLGFLSFFDNTVDTATGTISLKATFKNEDLYLWPGQFVHATVLLTTRPRAVVVSTAAIQTGQAGPFVYIVKPDMTVEMRPVDEGPTMGSLTVIDRGVAAGDVVVVEGQLRLRPGAKVQVATRAAVEQAAP